MLKVNLFVIITTFLILNLTTQAETTVEDQGGVLDKLKELTNRTFENRTISCGESVNYNNNVEQCHITCKKWYCKSECSYPATKNEIDTFGLYAEDCTPEHFFLYGDNGIIIEVTKKDYNKSGTWLISLLKNIDFYISPMKKVVLRSIMMTHFQDSSSGVDRPFFAYSILATAYTNNSKKGAVLNIGFDPNRKGLDQILFVYEGMFDYFMSLKHIKPVKMPMPFPFLQE